jgi:hypothetical protein
MREKLCKTLRHVLCLSLLAALAYLAGSQAETHRILDKVLPHRNNGSGASAFWAGAPAE